MAKIQIQSFGGKAAGKWLPFSNVAYRALDECSVRFKKQIHPFGIGAYTAHLCQSVRPDRRTDGL